MSVLRRLRWGRVSVAALLVVAAVAAVTSAVLISRGSGAHAIADATHCPASPAGPVGAGIPVLLVGRPVPPRKPGGPNGRPGQPTCVFTWAGQALGRGADALGCFEACGPQLYDPAGRVAADFYAGDTDTITGAAVRAHVPATPTTFSDDGQHTCHLDTDPHQPAAGGLPFLLTTLTDATVRSSRVLGLSRSWSLLACSPTRDRAVVISDDDTTIVLLRPSTGAVLATTRTAGLLPPPLTGRRLTIIASPDAATVAVTPRDGTDTYLPPPDGATVTVDPSTGRVRSRYPGQAVALSSAGQLLLLNHTVAPTGGTMIPPGSPAAWTQVVDASGQTRLQRPGLATGWLAQPGGTGLAVDLTPGTGEAAATSGLELWLTSPDRPAQALALVAAASNDHGGNLINGYRRFPP